MTRDEIQARKDEIMTRDEIKARARETVTFFDAAMKIAVIVEGLTAELTEYDAGDIARRVLDLVENDDGIDRETGDPITGPVA